MQEPWQSFQAHADHSILAELVDVQQMEGGAEQWEEGGGK